MAPQEVGDMAKVLARRSRTPVIEFFPIVVSTFKIVWQHAFEHGVLHRLDVPSLTQPPITRAHAHADVPHISCS